ncbi:MAG: biotin transporter BioY [Lachnospiraceae bacterium]|nr:biotin transporter BioY [Lachnospiraceae bacterium]
MNHSYKISTKNLVLIGLCSALLCVLAPWSITLPISPVPFTLGTLILYVITYILGLRKGLICFLIYLLLGFIGLPVFAGFTSGPSKLLGPTGGYLIGELFLVLILGFFLHQFKYKRSMFLLGMVFGTFLCYFFGTLWLAYINHLSFKVALSVGVLPYLLFDTIKIAFALFWAPRIRTTLRYFT